jgi:preprotein translocase subunit SecD
VLLAFALVGCSGKSGKARASRIHAKVDVERQVLDAWRTMTPSEMKRTIAIIGLRLRRLGIVGAKIGHRGARLVVVELPHGTELTSPVEAALQQTGRLAIFDFEASLAWPSVTKSFAPQPKALYPLLRAVASEVRARGASSYYMFTAKHEPLWSAPTKKQFLYIASRMGEAPGDVMLGVPAGMKVVACSRWVSRVCPGPRGSFVPKRKQTLYYLLKLPAPLTGEDIDVAGTHSSAGGSSGGPTVELAFDRHGGKVFKKMTERARARGETYGVQHLAIVLYTDVFDNNRLLTLLTVPTSVSNVQGGTNPSVSGMTIENLRSAAAARGLVTFLDTGAMPVYLDLRAPGWSPPPS